MRPTWEKYALMLAKTASLRSEDPYVKVGACVLRYDKSVAALGYNGPPRGVNINWEDRDERRKRVVHAESNALAYCKPGEVWLLACSLLPCHSCVQLAGAYGIKKIVYEGIYEQDDFGVTLAKEYGIELVQTKEENEKPYPEGFAFCDNGNNGCYDRGICSKCLAILVDPVCFCQGGNVPILFLRGQAK